MIIMQALQAHLDQGSRLWSPDSILINGRGANEASFTVESGASWISFCKIQISCISYWLSDWSTPTMLLSRNWVFFVWFPGKTYRFRISNVGLHNSLNFRIQGHRMMLVEVEGTHTLQTTLSSLDVHVGQSYSVLVTADQPAHDYHVFVSTSYTKKVLTATTAVLHYKNSRRPASGSDAPPRGKRNYIRWSMNQARSIRYSPRSPPENWRFRLKWWKRNQLFSTFKEHNYI